MDAERLTLVVTQTQDAWNRAHVLCVDSLPRMLSRAQKMDALTSQAGVTGYRAVFEAAHSFGRFLNGQITAAGKIPPVIIAAPMPTSGKGDRHPCRVAS